MCLHNSLFFRTHSPTPIPCAFLFRSARVLHHLSISPPNRLWNTIERSVFFRCSKFTESKLCGLHLRHHSKDREKESEQKTELKYTFNTSLQHWHNGKETIGKKAKWRREKIKMEKSKNYRKKGTPILERTFCRPLHCHWIALRCHCITLHSIHIKAIMSVIREREAIYLYRFLFLHCTTRTCTVQMHTFSASWE